MRESPPAAWTPDQAAGNGSRHPENLALLSLFIAGRLDPAEAPSFGTGELKIRARSLVERAAGGQGDSDAAPFILSGAAQPHGGS